MILGEVVVGVGLMVGELVGPTMGAVTSAALGLVAGFVAKVSDDNDRRDWRLPEVTS
jgi:hypothetical protein